MIERQTIVTWRTPNERVKPPIGVSVTATVSGKKGGAIYNHVLMQVERWDDGWKLCDAEMDELQVHAWCDLEPYGG